VFGFRKLLSLVLTEALRFAQGCPAAAVSAAITVIGVGDRRNYQCIQEEQGCGDDK
jgi:hypothetical protein